MMMSKALEEAFGLTGRTCPRLYHELHGYDGLSNMKDRGYTHRRIIFAPKFVKSEAVFEISDDRRNSSNDCSQSSVESISLSTRGGSLINRYVDSEISIHLHFHTISRNIPQQFEGGDFVLVFQKACIDDLHRADSNVFWNINHGLGDGYPRPEQVQSPVSISSSPFIENPNRAIAIGNHFFWSEAWSLVKLYRLNDVPSLLAQWPKHPGGVLTKISRLSENRKFKVLLIGGRFFPRLKHDSLINGSIESGSQMVKHLSKLEGEIFRDGLNFVQENAPDAIGLHVSANSVEVFAGNAVPHLGLSYCMVIRPFDSEPTILEWPHGSE